MREKIVFGSFLMLSLLLSVWLWNEVLVLFAFAGGLYVASSVACKDDEQFANKSREFALINFAIFLVVWVICSRIWPAPLVPLVRPRIFTILALSHAMFMLGTMIVAGLLSCRGKLRGKEER